MTKRVVSAVLAVSAVSAPTWFGCTICADRYILFTLWLKKGVSGGFSDQVGYQWHEKLPSFAAAVEKSILCAHGSCS